MRICNFNSNISFAKTLAATCHVKTKSGDFEQCKIFELDKFSDKNYFQKLTKDQTWDGNSFIDTLNYLMQMPYSNYHERTYAMENKNGECLGYIRTTMGYDIEQDEKISHIETCPKHKTKNKDREIKYIGQTLIAFLVGRAKKENRKGIYIESYLDEAKKFYEEKCNFKPISSRAYELTLSNKDYDSFLEEYKQNTKCKIKYYI